MFQVGKPHPPGKRADVRLGEPGLHERGQQAHLLGGFEPRTKIAQVIDVYAVSDMGNPHLSGDSDHLGHDVPFADVTAVRGVGDELRQVHFAGGHHAVRNTECPGDFSGREAFRAGMDR